MSSVRFEKCTHSCKYYHNQDISSSPPKKFPYALLQSILYSHLHCQEMNGLLSLSFCLSGMSYKFNHRVCILLVCLLSLSILLLKFIQVVTCNGSSFPFIDGQYYMVRLFHDLFTLTPWWTFWVVYSFLILWIKLVWKIMYRPLSGLG